MKYLAIANTRLMGSLIYERDMVVRSTFMLVAMVVFVQLWTTTYAATNQSIIGGFSLRDLVWYLVVTEVIALSTPRIAQTIDAEVRSGDVAYVVLVLASMLIFVAFGVLAGSLGFWIGNAEATAFQAQQATINFSLYPGSVFHGWIRVLLFRLVPAGFISHLPVELLRTFEPWRMAAVLGFTVLSVVLAIFVFRLGLRRYESGNLVVLRS
jgi:ABC-type uncharacterized transport system permease subunit